MHHHISDSGGIFEELLGVLAKRTKFGQAPLSFNNILIELRGQCWQINS